MVAYEPSADQDFGTGMKTTAKQFAEFKAECERLQSVWGINDWDVRVLHENPQSKTAIASCTPASTKRVAVIRLSRNIKPSYPSMKSLARHEMVHVLLGELSCIAGSRNITNDEIEAAEEALVQRLIRLLPK